MYNLNDFKNGKAFIYQEKCIDNEIVINNRICIDTKGNKLFELPEVGMIVNEFEDEDVAVVTNYDCDNALLDNKGNFLTDFSYDIMPSDFAEGFFPVKKNGKYGFIDLKGNEIIPCIYDFSYSFSEGIVAVKLNDKWGMVDIFNNIIIPFEYENMYVCCNNTIPVQKNGKWSVINKKNEVLIDFKYESIENLTIKNGFCYIAIQNGKYGLIDSQDNIIEEFTYDCIGLISDTDDIIGLYLSFEKDGKYALYSTKRKTFLTDFKYDFIEFCYENRFCVNINGKVGVIDINGETIAPAVYDCTFMFYDNGILTVMKNNLWGALDLAGNNVIPCEYHFLGNFNEGVACATNKEHQEGYIDNNNNAIKNTPFSFL